MKITYGILGKPLGHSYSPDYFAQLFEREGISDKFEYKKFEIEHEQIPNLFTKEPFIQGFNITIPYKKEIWKFLSKADRAAISIGAVNVVKKEGDIWCGYNTDVIGFGISLKRIMNCSKTQIKDSVAVVLGNGGASAAVQYVFDKFDIPYDIVVRNNNILYNKKEGINNFYKGELCRDIISYQDLHNRGFLNYNIAVNTTPVGTFPNVFEYIDLPYKTVSSNSFLFFDLVYNPEPTVMMEKFSNQGCIVKGGLEMLHLQAQATWCIWHPEYNTGEKIIEEKDISLYDLNQK